MIFNNATVCPVCGGELKYYDSVKRIVRSKRRVTKRVIIPRVRCLKCGALHRDIPELVLPHKQYEAEIIRGVIEGLITSDTLGFENYPCEMTMSRWRGSQKLQVVL